MICELISLLYYSTVDRTSISRGKELSTAHTHTISNMHAGYSIVQKVNNKQNASAHDF